MNMCYKASRLATHISVQLKRSLSDGDLSNSGVERNQCSYLWGQLIPFIIFSLMPNFLGFEAFTTIG